jgi:hypothetical protein
MTSCRVNDGLAKTVFADRMAIIIVANIAKVVRRMERRFFITGAVSSVALTGCVAGSPSAPTVANSMQQNTRALQLSILVGAAVGFAVARSRGGSALVGIALGGFAGGAISVAMQYARLVWQQNQGNLPQSYEQIADTASTDRATFVRENVPLINERYKLARSLQGGAGNTQLVGALGTIRDLDRQEKKTTVPSEAYFRAAPVYPESVTVLPQLGGYRFAPDIAKVPHLHAWQESQWNLGTVNAGRVRYSASTAILREMGLDDFI